jgi:DNA-directed RNA polymerase I and III subunit RPAC2
MNLRIQTYGELLQDTTPKSGLTDKISDGVSVYAVLEKGLEDLMAMCDVVEEKFTVARDDFVNKMQE